VRGARPVLLGLAWLPSAGATTLLEVFIRMTEFASGTGADDFRCLTGRRRDPRPPTRGHWSNTAARTAPTSSPLLDGIDKHGMTVVP
jgi:hypothetical protein